jgi:hypothetical protein
MESTATIKREVCAVTIEDITEKALQEVVRQFLDSVQLTTETLPLFTRLMRLAKVQGKLEAAREMTAERDNAKS